MLQLNQFVRFHNWNGHTESDAKVQDEVSSEHLYAKCQSTKSSTKPAKIPLAQYGRGGQNRAIGSEYTYAGDGCDGHFEL